MTVHKKMNSRRSLMLRAAVVVGLVAASTLAAGGAVSAAGAAVSAAPAAGAAFAATPAAAVAPAAVPATGVSYVALGDSYSSGLGLLPASGNPGCGQSSTNYPHQLAKTLGLSLTDVTCAGAAADNIWKTPQTLADGSTVPVQTSALNASTAIVTLTVGGNGLKFTDIAKVCAAKTATGPLYLPALSSFPTCQAYFAYAGTDLPGTITGPVTTDLRATYAAIRAAAPNAKVFVLGYPTIAPGAGKNSCFTPLGTPNSFPFTDTDTPYLHGIETLYATTVKTEALNAGFTYIPTFEKSSGNSVCSGTPFVNGVTLDPSTFIAETSLHPNSDGMTFMATAARPQVALRTACVLLHATNYSLCA